MHGAACTHFSAVVQLSKVCVSVYELFNEELTELPAILGSFSSIPQVLTQGWLVGVVGSHKSGGEKHIRKLDLQTGSNKVLLCLNPYKK